MSLNLNEFFIFNFFFFKKIGSKCVEFIGYSFKFLNISQNSKDIFDLKQKIYHIIGFSFVNVEHQQDVTFFYLISLSLVFY